MILTWCILVDLPQFSSYTMLRTQLLLAINEGGEGSALHRNSLFFITSQHCVYLTVLLIITHRITIF